MQVMPAGELEDGGAGADDGRDIERAGNDRSGAKWAHRRR